MKIYNRTRIAYIAGRLITGKRIASPYDFNNLSHIEIVSLPDAIDLSIKGNTFMGKITGSTAYFIGNVRGDLIYIYDHEDSLHLNYRISGFMFEKENGDSCKSCWMTNQESASGAVS